MQDYHEAFHEIAKCELQDAPGTNQLRAGQDTEAMTFKDKTNPFNHLNRKVTLLNCESICLARSYMYILINNYYTNSQLFVDRQCIHVFSKQGTTACDSLAMTKY